MEEWKARLNSPAFFVSLTLLILHSQPDNLHTEEEEEEEGTFQTIHQLDVFGPIRESLKVIITVNKAVHFQEFRYLL